MAGLIAEERLMEERAAMTARLAREQLQERQEGYHVGAIANTRLKPEEEQAMRERHLERVRVEASNPFTDEELEAQYQAFKAAQTPEARKRLATPEPITPNWDKLKSEAKSLPLGPHQQQIRETEELNQESAALRRELNAGVSPDRNKVLTNRLAQVRMKIQENLQNPRVRRHFNYTSPAKIKLEFNEPKITQPSKQPSTQPQPKRVKFEPVKSEEPVKSSDKLTKARDEIAQSIRFTHRDIVSSPFLKKHGAKLALGGFVGAGMLIAANTFSGIGQSGRSLINDYHQDYDSLKFVNQ